MRATWIVSALLVVAAVGSGAYYYSTKVNVVVEAPPPVQPVKPEVVRGDTFGDSRTAKQMVFPGAQGSSNGGGQKGQN